LFIESKQRKKDGIKLSQAKWMQTALELGVAPASFAIVECEAKLTTDD